MNEPTIVTTWEQLERHCADVLPGWKAQLLIERNRFKEFFERIQDLTKRGRRTIYHVAYWTGHAIAKQKRVITTSGIVYPRYPNEFLRIIFEPSGAAMVQFMPGVTSSEVLIVYNKRVTRREDL